MLGGGAFAILCHAVLILVCMTYNVVPHFCPVKLLHDFDAQNMGIQQTEIQLMRL